MRTSQLVPALSFRCKLSTLVATLKEKNTKILPKHKFKNN